jgi:hypothetical protein
MVPDKLSEDVSDGVRDREEDSVDVMEALTSFEDVIEFVRDCEGCEESVDVSDNEVECVSEYDSLLESVGDALLDPVISSVIDFDTEMSSEGEAERLNCKTSVLDKDGLEDGDPVKVEETESDGDAECSSLMDGESNNVHVRE